MRGLVGALDRRRELAARGRPYVARIHDAPVIANKLLGYYQADYPALASGTLPDWFSLEGKREIEKLHSRIFRLEQELVRERRDEDRLRRQLGLPQLGIGDREHPQTRSEKAKELLPGPVRRVLRRGRAKAEGRRA